MDKLTFLDELSPNNFFLLYHFLTHIDSNTEEYSGDKLAINLKKVLTEVSNFFKDLLPSNQIEVIRCVIDSCDRVNRDSNIKNKKHKLDSLKKLKTRLIELMSLEAIEESFHSSNSHPIKTRLLLLECSGALEFLRTQFLPNTELAIFLSLIFNSSEQNIRAELSQGKRYVNKSTQIEFENICNYNNYDNLLENYYHLPEVKRNKKL